MKRLATACAIAALISLLPAGPALPKSSLPTPQQIIKDNPGAGRLLDVPFIAQTQFDCGPASVAMVLRYHGVEADEKEILGRFETQALAGTFTVDLLIAASDAGMDAHWVAGNMERLKKEIDQGRPPIVFLNLSINPLPRRHFAVAVGYINYRGKYYVVLHSGEEKYMMVPVKKFERQWKRTGNMMMTVARKIGPDQKVESGR